MRKYIAECVGTMFLVLLACGSAVLAGPKIGVLGIGLCFGLVVLGATDARKGFGKFAGLAIGLALGLVNIVGITVDNCSVNPARSFGPALWCPEAWPDFWIMVVGPLVGAAIAALCWIVLTGNRNRHAIED